MWEVLIKIVEKFACKHEWVIIVDEHEKSPLVNGKQQEQTNQKQGKNHATVYNW
jgi:hypothetical protein